MSTTAPLSQPIPIPRDASPPAAAARPEYLAILLLWLVYMIHGVDRSVLLVLLPPIQADYRLSDSEVGLLSGIAYALPFALVGIPMGMLVDRVNRTRLLATLLAIWSLATIAAGFTRHFATLVLARAVVGAAESGAPPTMISLMSDVAPPRSRPLALGIFFTGPFAGVVVGSTIAGWVTLHAGWREALFVAGAPGLILAALLVICLREPKRGRFDEQEASTPAPLRVALAHLVRDRATRAAAAAMVLSGFVNIAVGAWLSVFLMRVHAFTIDQTGVVTALVMGVFGGAGVVIMGLVASWIGRGEPVRLLRLCGWATLFSLPPLFVGILAESSTIAVIGLCVWGLFVSAFLGPAYSTMTALLPVELRGTAMAVIVVSTHLVGAGLGPQAVGVASDVLRWLGDDDGLRHALAVVTLVSLIPGALYLYSARRIAAYPIQHAQGAAA